MWYNINPDLQIHTDDYVSYTVEMDGKEKQYLNVICYRDCFANLYKSSFHLYPAYSRESQLSHDEFVTWNKLCEENGLIPHGCTYETTKKMNQMRVPKSTHYKAYSTLCCYRWTQNFPSLPLLVLKLLEKKPSLNFYQALSYSCSKYVTNHGHSFNTIHSGYYAATKGTSLPLNQMFTMPIFYKSETANKTSKVDQFSYVSQIALNDLEKSLGLSPIYLTKRETYLDENLTPLFNEKLTTEKLKKAIKESEQSK